MFKFLGRLIVKSPPRRPIVVRRRATPAVETLQDRVLPSVSVTLTPAHQLVIIGDNAPNHVTISQGATTIDVVADGKNFSFDSASVKLIFFAGRGGNDVFVNNTAVSSIALGGAGDDMLQGGSGDDILIGGRGNNILTGGGGNDFVLGGAGNDHMHGGAGNDILIGLAGNDTEHGGAGNDFLAGNAGNDNLMGDDGDDIELGGAGNDHLNSGTGVDHLNGGAGVDVGVGDDDDTETEIEHNELGATLTGTTNAIGFAEVKQSMTSTVLKIELENAPPNQTFNVLVDNVNVGTLTTDGEGEAEVKLTVTTPTIQAGSVVTITDLQNVTLVQGTLGQAKEEDDDNQGNED